MSEDDDLERKQKNLLLFTIVALALIVGAIIGAVIVTIGVKAQINDYNRLLTKCYNQLTQNINPEYTIPRLNFTNG